MLPNPKRTFVFVLLAIVYTPQATLADSYRLRSDAFAAAQPGTGLIVLHGEHKAQDWMTAEALIWGGIDRGPNSNNFDALVMFLRAQHPKGLGEVRLGRMILSTGAVRPVHMDGIHATFHAPWGTNVETFAGLPVVPHFGARDSDWLAGARVAHTKPKWGTLGLSIVHRRDEGRLSHEELGMDAITRPVSWLTVTGRGAWSLITPGISYARLAATARSKTRSLTAHIGRRSPSRLLPATSLFSALGDFASDEAGVTSTWHAAPRLDLRLYAAVRSARESSWGTDLNGRALLRLNDDGTKAVSLALHRQTANHAPWTGIRLSGHYSLSPKWLATTELEIAIPDDDTGHGAVWPWGLTSLRRQFAKAWNIAVAVEGGASPEHTWAMDALLRVSHTYEVAP